MCTHLREGGAAALPSSVPSLLGGPVWNVQVVMQWLREEVLLSEWLRVWRHSRPASRCCCAAAVLPHSTCLRPST